MRSRTHISPRLAIWSSPMTQGVRVRVKYFCMTCYNNIGSNWAVTGQPPTAYRSATDSIRPAGHDSPVGLFCQVVLLVVPGRQARHGYAADLHTHGGVEHEPDPPVQYPGFRERSERLFVAAMPGCRTWCMCRWCDPCAWWAWIVLSVCRLCRPCCPCRLCRPCCPCCLCRPCQKPILTPAPLLLFAPHCLLLFVFIVCRVLLPVLGPFVLRLAPIRGVGCVRVADTLVIATVLLRRLLPLPHRDKQSFMVPADRGHGTARRDGQGHRHR